MRYLGVVAGVMGMAWGLCVGQTTQPAWGKPSNGLSLTVETDKTVYAPGEPIKIKVTYRNHTDKPLKLWSPQFPHGMDRFGLGSVRVQYLPVVQPSGLVLVVGGKTVQARLPCKQIPPAGVRVQWLTIDPAGPWIRTGKTPGLELGRRQLHAVALGWGLRHHWVGAAVSNRTTIEVPSGFGPRTWAVNWRRRGFDAEATRKKLAKAVGGTWHAYPSASRTGDRLLGRVPVPGDGTGRQMRLAVSDLAAPADMNHLTSYVLPRRKVIVWLNDQCRVVVEGSINPVADPEVARKVVEAIAGPPPKVELPSADAGLVASGGENLWPDAPPREGLAGLKRFRLNVTATDTDLLNRFSKPEVIRQRIQARLKKDLPAVSLDGTESDWALRIDVRRHAEPTSVLVSVPKVIIRLHCTVQVDRACVVDGRRVRGVAFAYPPVLLHGRDIGVEGGLAAVGLSGVGLKEALAPFVAAWRKANE